MDMTDMNNTALIKAPVGNNLRNDESDVHAVKQAFTALGRFDGPEVNGFITRPLDTAIRDYQRDRNLRIDGVIDPGGETEANLQRDLAQLAEPPLEVPAMPPSLPMVNREAVLQKLLEADLHN